MQRARGGASDGVQRIFALLLLLAATSCSLVLQDGVRRRSVYCSTSRFYWMSDVLVGAASTYVAATRIPDRHVEVVYAPSALFLGSGLLGIYKRHNCVRWRETAPPEEWERMAAVVRAEQEAAARAAEQAEAERAARQAALDAQAQQQQQDQQPQDQPQQPQPAGDHVSRPPPQITHLQPLPTPGVRVEVHAASDELGKGCDPSVGFIGDNPDAGWPHAGSCHYGAVCYHRRCTVWCDSNRQCPSGLHCAPTTGTAPTELCQ
jgi:hypothetical protein